MLPLPGPSWLPVAPELSPASLFCFTFNSTCGTKNAILPVISWTFGRALFPRPPNFSLLVEPKRTPSLYFRSLETGNSKCGSNPSACSFPGSQIYKAVFDGFTDAVLLADLDERRILLANDAVEVMLGYPRDELLGQRFDSLLALDEENAVRLDQGGSSAQPVKCAHGRLRMMDVTGSLIQTPDAWTGVLITLRDATERIERERRLREEERRYRAIVEDQHDLICRWRPDGAITFVNQAFCRSRGKTAAELLETSFFDQITSPESRDALRQAAHDAASSSGQIPATTREEPHLVHAKAQLVAWEAWIDRAIFDGQGRVFEFQSVGRDITELKRVQEDLIRQQNTLAERVEERTADLQTANAELTKAIQSKDQFLAMISHELRTPLVTILGMADAIFTGGFGEIPLPLDKPLRTMRRAADGLRTQISDLLDLARISAGSSRVSFDPVDIRLVCQVVMEEMKLLAKEKGVSLRSDIPDKLATLQADPARLRQVITNLMTNAIKFTPQGGLVVLRVSPQPEIEQVSFHIADTGIGIALEDQPRLFQPFSQVDHGLNRRYEGTGLGLAIVASLTHALGGGIELHSRPEEGSEFTLRLPRYGSSPHFVRSLSTQDADRLNHASVLVAEGIPSSIDYWVKPLRRFARSVRIAPTTEECLEQVRAESPSILIADLTSASLGQPLLKALRSNPLHQHIPILATRSVILEGDKFSQAHPGSAPFGLISKPVAVSQILQEIASILRQPGNSHD